MPVDEQLAEIVLRLTPAQGQIGHLVDELVASEGDDAGSVIEVVRYFNDPEGVDEVRRVSRGLVSLSGQHQLLGWNLGRSVLDFMNATRATLDVDEYG